MWVFIDLQDTTSSNSSDQIFFPQSNKYNQSWTSYSKSKGNECLLCEYFSASI